ncbi:MAG: late competence development ComFB family protein [Spirochaetaceae bacterium]|jgi:competence protein ComFB|nr:late competence development ComFB family protein [Spirochaetaceae bacterium]
MGLTDQYNFELLGNQAEQLVFDELERQLAAFEGELCRCNDCVADMAAMALNMVKPLYRYSLLGTLYAAQAMTDEAYAASIREAVSEAIEKIHQNPSHD